MSTPIQVIEDAIVDSSAGRITRAEAVERIQSVVEVSTLGALQYLDSPVAPRARYEQVADDAQRLRDRLDGAR